jgi:hypothetical protein
MPRFIARIAHKYPSFVSPAPLVLTAQGRCGAFVNNAVRFPWWIQTEVVNILGTFFFFFFFNFFILLIALP